MRTRNRRHFESVFDRHFEDVYAYVAYRVAPDREAAKDITQEVFLAAVAAWPSFRGDGDALAWLRGIAQHKVTDHFRSRPAASAPFEPDVEQLPSPSAPAESTPQERGVLVSLAMRELPDQYVEILEAKYLDGLSVRQIARRRGGTEKAVESALSRAREAFRKTYAKIQARKERES